MVAEQQREQVQAGLAAALEELGRAGLNHGLAMETSYGERTQTVRAQSRRRLEAAALEYSRAVRAALDAF